MEFKKNSLYKPLVNNSYNWEDQPLNVVKDPQNPNPKTSLYLRDIGSEFINPSKKQPIKFTTKVSLTCHLNIAPGTAPIEIKK